MNGVEVPRAIIVNSLTEQEFEDFTNAEIEKQTQVKTYCSNSECGRFIAPCYIAAGEATCPRCKTRTCTMCNSPQHEGDCPADTGLEAILDLGAENQWRRCFSCRSMVSIERGCNHMTCRCGAEFCYQCGTEWTKPRQCSCAFWIEENLIRRAEQVVGRTAPLDLQPAERQRRVAAVQDQLRHTDECEHRGRKKFTQIYNGGRQGFRCEMCNARHWRFIMRCRRCQLEISVAFPARSTSLDGIVPFGS
ncbi:hypothetical protein PTTW11_00952 [Pyrenophora teres f. teres]|uniref:RBR-type E3 ubiquitin transferase n=1 Tax=Pyrenophora teres f. teres TaxID=97479 RepID=A0A6S6VPV1_9PLEO|nr:hypothetical protein PTTW11_00952 [Pyrenophora teres f. teres]